MNHLEKIIVTDYEDYREIIEQLFLREKELKSCFSYEYCAKKLGVSKSYLKLLTQKKNHSSIDKIHSLCELFELSEDEFRYILILYLYNSTSNSHAKKCFKDILSILSEKVTLLG